MPRAQERVCYPHDIYTGEATLEPYGHYRALRDLGPAVWLEAHDAFAVARYADVRAVLTDTAAFRSRAGIALNDPANGFGGSVLTSDGDEHAHLRKIYQAGLPPRAVRPLRSTIEARARELVASLVPRGSFDAVADLARALPMSIVPDLLGLPVEDRDRLLEWSAALFDFLGPLNERAQRGAPLVDEMAGFAARLAETGGVTEGSLAAGVLAARDRGDLDDQQAVLLVVDYLPPSLDTTISALGNAVWLFGRHPEQWDRVRADPSLIPNAVNEVVRLESPLRAFGRRVESDTEIGGVAVPAGSRVLALFASANRDERFFDRADTFDVTRAEAGRQVGFGFGQHVCPGQHLARIEAESLLAALAERVRRFHLGEGTRAANNIIRGFARLSVTVEA